MTLEGGTKGIIVDARSLSADVQPRRVVGRDKQICKLGRQLTRAERLAGSHAWLYGLAGSGKTTVSRRVAGRVDEGLEAVCLVNCWQNRTLHSVLQTITYELRIFMAENTDTGLKTHRIRQALRGRPLVVILDEIDRPMPAQRQEILYGLLQVPEVSLICIANSVQPLATLDERIRSRMSPALIEFPPYTDEQLAEILTDRAEMGLASGSWSRQVLRRVASAANGDARAAIHILRQAAAVAEEDDSPRIKPKHSAGPIGRQRMVNAEARLVKLTEDERMIRAIAADRGPLGTLDLRRRYLDQCESVGHPPIAERTFTKYIRRLASAGLLSISDYPQANRGRLVRAA
ncbi:MAG: Cdc6/Cdc18 family protein [bacterium]